MKLKSKTGLTIILLFITLSAMLADEKKESYIAEITAWQEELNREFADSSESPLTAEDRARFHGLDFYPIDIRYRVTARFERTPDENQFGMKTTTERRPVYVRYGIAYFKLFDKNLKINIYQNIHLSKNEKYKDYLFMLFTDLSSGKESYAGGRYIDLRIPEGDSIIIDFNKAYNPYCAYNHKYSCPIPPEEDHFDLEIRAGCKKGFH